MQGPSHHTYRQINLAILGFLLVSCLFFTGFDLIYVGIWWSTVSIYLPCGLVFLFGFLAWQELNTKRLTILGIVFLAIDLFLMGYGSWLWVNGEALWGPLTIGFGMLTTFLTWSALRVGRSH